MTKAEMYWLRRGVNDARQGRRVFGGGPYAGYSMRTRCRYEYEHRSWLKGQKITLAAKETA